MARGAQGAGVGGGLKRRAARAPRMVANTAELVLETALRSWLRNLRTAMPALGTMSLLLVLAGISGLAGLAARNLVEAESRNASVVHVYLKEGAADEEVAALRAKLRGDPAVSSIDYVSKEQALQDARRRPGLPGLATDAAVNPFPASLEVHLRRLQDAGRLAALAAGDPAVDPVFPTSYDAGTYDRLTTLVTVAGLVVAGVLLLLAAVATVVTVNAVRAAILSRRSEIATMHLVGASGWMIRGPFVFEGALTGGLAGLLAAGAVIGLFAGLQQLSVQAFSQLLPGVDWRAAGECAGAVLLGGAALGSFASLFGLRGLRA